MTLKLITAEPPAHSRYIATVDCVIAELRDCLDTMSMIIGDVPEGNSQMIAMSALRTAMVDRLTLTERELGDLERAMVGREACKA